MSLDGDTLLVGSPRKDILGGTPVGAAYVFVRDGASPTGWTEEARLDLGAGSGHNYLFGQSVALDGDTAVIGAPGASYMGGVQSGSAYVFVRSGTSWSQEALLPPDAGDDNEFFGVSVALDGDTAVVGAWSDDDGGLQAGAAYVFVRSGTTWSQEAKLLAGPPGTSFLFGRSVAVDGDTALVGAPGDDSNGFGAGAIFVFERSGTTWTAQERLLASDGVADDQLGFAVAFEDETAVAGAHNNDVGASNSGAAYVWVRSGSDWVQQNRLVPRVGQSNAEFGYSVALRGEVVLVGAHDEDETGVDSGVAYVFARHAGAWSEQARLVPADSAEGDEFGFAVALGMGEALVSASRTDDFGDDSGAWYAFAIPAPSGTAYCACPAGPCGNPDPAAGCANSTGAGAELTAVGATQPDEVNLLVTGSPPGQFAIFFQGDDASLTPFGDGFVCAAGSVVRITVPPLTIGADGTAEYGLCFGDPPISGVTGVVPGSGVTKRYQFWYRDPSGPCGSGFNLSNGYEITW
jgi:hypothetical protein